MKRAILVLAVLAVPLRSIASGHGPLFGLATPTNSQGEFSFDFGVFGRKSTRKNAFPGRVSRCLGREDRDHYRKSHQTVVVGCGEALPNFSGRQVHGGRTRCATDSGLFRTECAVFQGFGANRWA
jgi:hypothetical protein